MQTETSVCLLLVTVELPGISMKVGRSQVDSGFQTCNKPHSNLMLDSLQPKQGKA